MAKDESKEDNEIQRIYVGGIAPPLLTVEMVQSRLIKTLSEAIDIISFDASKSKTNLWGEDTQTFFFMTAKLKNIENGRRYDSALDAVAKLYNNVKWKNCTLKVEKARLHILDRLKLEREQLQHERDKNLINTNESSIQILDGNHDNSDATHTKKLKRHLRIRRRFGEEAYVVDTKPIEANNQKELHLSLKKHREKLTKHIDLLHLSKKKKKDQWAKDSLKQESNVSLQSKVFLNRAVHIHFDESNIDHNYMTHKLFDEKVERQPTVSDNNSDSTGSVSSRSDSDDDIDETKEEEGKIYAWSDEDSSEDSVRSTDNNEKDLYPSIPNDEESISSEESNPSEDTRGSDKGYMWSDSDDESSGEEKMNNTTKEYDYNKTKHDDLDEFAAFFNDEADDSSPHDNTSHYDDSEMAKEAAIDLGDDVKSNLVIVAKLFPEIATKVPISFTSEGEKRQSQNTVGLDSFGIIQRYDPFSESIANHDHDTEQDNSDLKYEPNQAKVLQDDDEKDHSSPSESSVSEESGSDDDDDDGDDDNDNDDRDVKDSKGNDIMTVNDSMPCLPTEQHQKGDEPQKDSGTKPVMMEHIYEQKKLENIFQQDRTSVGTTAFSMSSLFQTEIGNHGASALSQGANGGFSFSFEPGQDDSQNANSSDIVEPNVIQETAVKDVELPASLIEVSADQLDSTAPVLNLKKRRGMTFSEQELDAYVNDFFQFNEGIDLVTEHLQNMKSSMYLKSQDEWHEQRKSLTSDWKRKHKFAVAQRKKKFRYR
jgi:hypothetical protein